MKWQSNASYGKPVEDGTTFMNENKSIQVHRIIHCSGWYLTCADLGFSRTQLNGNEFDDAVSDAKRLIQQRLDTINHKYGIFINDNSKNEIVRYL